MSNLCRIWPLPSSYMAALPWKAVKEHMDMHWLWPAHRRNCPSHINCYIFSVLTHRALILKSAHIWFFPYYLQFNTTIQTWTNSNVETRNQKNKTCHIHFSTHTFWTFLGYSICLWRFSWTELSSQIPIKSPIWLCFNVQMFKYMYILLHCYKQNVWGEIGIETLALFNVRFAFNMDLYCQSARWVFKLGGDLSVFDKFSKAALNLCMHVCTVETISR